LTQIEKTIYKYIDEFGVPFILMASFSAEVDQKDLPFLNSLMLDSSILDWRVIGWESEIKISFPFDTESVDVQSLVSNYVYETIGIEIPSIRKLPSLANLDGKPFFLVLNEHEHIKLLSVAKPKLNGSLITRSGKWNFGFSSLGRIREIQGDFGVDSVLSDFGSLCLIKGDLWFSNYVEHKLKSLSPLQKITGNANFKNLGASLESLEYVGGNLNLRKSNVSNLIKLNYVGGNILLSKYQESVFNFSNVDVRGKVKVFNDDQPEMF
jgi:hypothetical protein